MNRKKRIFIIVMVFTIGLAIPAGAWIYVPPMGDTGWQSYTYTAGPSGFTGTAGFVVSNEGDYIFDSWLLLDNLSHAGESSNKSFELGNYTGYNLGPSSDRTVVDYPITALSGNVYNPTEGSYMSFQQSFDDDTSGFLSAFGNPGTNGSILETAIALGSGESFTFDWAFLAIDYWPQDFSLFYLKDDGTGNIVFSDGLGQEVIPEPNTLLLLGSGLFGLAGVGLRRKRVI